MESLQYQALSIVFFPQKNIDQATVFALFDFLRDRHAGNIQFNNTFPLGVPAPFPLISANVGGWQITVNGRRIDFLCNKPEVLALAKQKQIILEIFESCLVDKINRLGLVAQFKCGDIPLNLFLSSNLTAPKGFSLNSLAYVNKIDGNEISLYDNIQIVRNNSQDFPYVCVRDLNTGTLAECFKKDYLDKAIQIATDKFSLDSIREKLYGTGKQ